jgi:hypothetical protein
MAKYYHTHKVPTWVVLHPSKKADKVKKWFAKSGAYFPKDLAKGFKDTVLSYKNKGWASQFDKPPTHQLSDQLLNIAFAEHIKKNTFSHITYEYPSNLTCRMDRRVSTEEEYEALFNQMLSLISEIELSYMFQVQELCSKSTGDNYHLFLTEAGFCNTVVNSLSKKIIQIGDGEAYDINLNDADKKISSFLEEKLTAIIGENK